MTPPDTRPEPLHVADERATLLGFLEFQRATFEWKCAGLSDAQLRERALPPSALSLLGLLRHLADVERGWFQRAIAGRDAPPLHYSDDDPDGDFDHVETADVAAARAAWRAECAEARRILDGVASLDVTYDRPGDPRETITVRWTLVHMIEEYARHNGHADLLRERIDGATGE